MPTDALPDSKQLTAARRSSQLGGRQKAAVLLVSLGRERATEVFRHLKEDEIEALSQVDTPGSNGYGLTASGAVEMSNVDLASEFTNMITAQRGFQANSRVISTADEVLQELVNLKR